jgi:DtxR family Mn-dependent transcriptional regulator
MTQSLEDYLKTVGILAEKGKVRITDIANQLNVSKPSTVSALKTLESQGFVIHERYRTVVLTKRGKEKVTKLKERYEFILSFLQNIVGVSPAVAIKDSCKIEHIVSEETLKKNEKYV